MLAPSLVPTTIASAASALPNPNAAGHLAGFVPASWNANGSAVDAFDLLWRADATASITAAKLYEWYLRVLTFADSTFTTTFAANTLTDTGHGLRTGAGPVYLSNAGGALPAGLSADTPYWIIFVDVNTMQLAASLEDAMQENAVSFTDDGTGTHTMSDDPSNAQGNGVTQQAIVSLKKTLGEAGDGAFSLAVGLGHSELQMPHRFEVVGYSVSATISAGNVTVEMLPRGKW